MRLERERQDETRLEREMRLERDKTRLERERQDEM